MSIFTTEKEIQYLDLNKNNELKNSAIINLMQDTAGEHSESIHDGLNDKDKHHTAWILLNWKIKVFFRPKYKDIVRVNTWARSFDKCCSYRDFEIYCDKKLVAKATSKWVLVNSVTGKITRIPEERVNQYGASGKGVFEEEMEEKLKEPESSMLTFQDKIGRTKIDTNNHLNNVYYLDYAIESLPEDVYENNEFNDIEIMYKKASRYKDNIKCYYACENGKHIITIKDGENNIHAIVKMW